MPTLGVDVAVIQDERVLLTLREDFRVWCLPGGGVDPGESVAQAAIREVLEETGLTVTLTRVVGVYSRPQWMQGGDHVVLFAAHHRAGTVHPAPQEVLDVRYFALDQLPEKLLWWHRRYIADVAAGMGGSCATTLGATWPFRPGMSRTELYALRDRGEIPADLLAQLWQSPLPGMEIQEVGGEREA